jgi:hypothetical protein
MKALTAIMFLISAAVTAEARIISDWPYSKLVKEADFVAVVEVASVTNSTDRLTGHRDPAQYQGKIARLKVGWVIKGEPTTTEVELLFFAYSSMGEPNGALFISFNEPDKHQYLVFLKRDGDKLIPVTGHYDASISVKVLKQDAFSRIERK